MSKRASTDRQWASAEHPTTLRSTPPVLVPGAMVGTFSVEIVLGAGGMADVVGVEDRAANRRLALKIARAGDAESKARLAREGEILRLVGAPGAVHLHGAGTLPDGRSYLAMDWLAGETLGARLERGPLAPAEAARLAAGLARALRHVHAAGVIHGDLKPDNIFLVGRALASVTLLDFGIARRLGDGPCGRVDGTPLFLAPEQAAGAALTPAADLYAVGAVLFTAVCGRPPFLAEQSEALLRAHLESTPPLLRSICPDAPPEMEALVAGLLVKKVSARATLDTLELAVGLRTPGAGRTRRDSPGVVFLSAAGSGGGVVMRGGHEGHGGDDLASGSAPPMTDDVAATIVRKTALPSGRWMNPPTPPSEFHVAAVGSAVGPSPYPASARAAAVPTPAPAVARSPSPIPEPQSPSQPYQASLDGPPSPFGLTLDLGAAVTPVDLRPRRMSGFFLFVVALALIAVGVGWWMSRTAMPVNAIVPIVPTDARL